MPAILNVLIGVVFVFLLFSLLVSALNEIILSTLDKRADFLKEGLRELLQNPQRVSDFLGHGLIDALSRKTGGNPSYIGKDPFVAAVLDLIKPANPTEVRTIADFQTAVAALPNDKFRQSLSAILDGADNNLEKFKQGLGAWYDHSMERVSGWYTRYAQKWLFALGLIVAIACNVDTIHITQTLSADPKLAVATADQASNFLKTNAASSAGEAKQDAAALDSMSKNVQTEMQSLNALHLPIGWDPDARQRFGVWQPDRKIAWPKTPAVLFSALCGWLLTALAGTLGAPFWFDTLNRFVNIRGNGRAPNEKDLPTKKARS